MLNSEFRENLLHLHLQRIVAVIRAEDSIRLAARDPKKLKKIRNIPKYEKRNMKKHFYLSFFGDKKASKKSGRGNCPGPNYTVSIVKPILRIRTKINFGTRLCKNSRTGKVRFQDRVPRLLRVEIGND